MVRASRYASPSDGGVSANNVTVGLTNFIAAQSLN
jgi:hypothetical protein